MSTFTSLHRPTRSVERAATAAGGRRIHRSASPEGRPPHKRPRPSAAETGRGQALGEGLPLRARRDARARRLFARLRAGRISRAPIRPPQATSRAPGQEEAKATEDDATTDCDTSSSAATSDAEDSAPEDDDSDARRATAGRPRGRAAHAARTDRAPAEQGPKTRAHATLARGESTAGAERIATDEDASGGDDSDSPRTSAEDGRNEGSDSSREIATRAGPPRRTAGADDRGTSPGPRVDRHHTSADGSDDSAPPRPSRGNEAGWERGAPAAHGAFDSDEYASSEGSLSLRAPTADPRPNDTAEDTRIRLDPDERGRISGGRAGGPDERPASGEGPGPTATEVVAAQRRTLERAALRTRVLELKLERAEQKLRQAEGGRGDGPMRGHAGHARAPPRGPLTARLPTTLFSVKYTGDEGTRTINDWERAATQSSRLFEGCDDRQLVHWLSTGLDGSASLFYEQWYAQNGGPPSSPQELYELLRVRFRRANERDLLRAEYRQLKQGVLSVDEYYSRFVRLVNQLPFESADSRLFDFRTGLSAALQVIVAAQATPITTLELLVPFAARNDPRAAAKRVEALHHVEVQREDDADAEGGGALRGQIQQLREEMLTAVREMRGNAKPAAGAGGATRYDTRTDRGANKRSQANPMWKQAGLTPEVAQKRREANLCMWCGQSGHRMFSCPARSANQPATLN